MSHCVGFDSVNDYIDFENKKLIKYNHETIFDGTENWTRTAGSSGRPAYFRLSRVSDYRPSSTQNASTQMSNYFYFGAPTTSNTALGMSVYVSGGTTTYIRVRDDELTSIDLIKAFCLEKYNDGTPVRLIWRLNTPIETSIDLPDVLLAKGTSIVGFGTTNQPPSASFKWLGETGQSVPYLTTELGDILTTEVGDALETTIGMYVDELDNQIITEDGNEWEVE